ncbi:O-antigen ligase family protein, partial [Candidatus Pelagibacter sp.]|nr:O-antigen ligase family protein [Candidatus Pelagibacter sp.]
IYLITKENFLYSKIIINLQILILLIVLFRYSFPFFIAFFSTPLSFYNMWPMIYNYDFSVPRPTGLARTSLILISFFIVFEFKNKKLSIINDLIIIFCSLNIILLQSRTIFFLCPLIILMYLFYSNLNNKLKFKKFLLFIVLPIIIFFSFNYTKHLIVNFEFIKSKSEGNSNGILNLVLPNHDAIKKSEPKKIQLFRDTDPNSFSSMRTLHWKRIFENSKKNFLGHGPMGDRFVGETSASSLFFYTLASSGYIGLIFIIILAVRAAYLVIYFIFVKRIIYYKKDVYLIFSCFVLIILFLRGILETSLGIFSIDYLLFISAILICEINFSKYKLKDNTLDK